MADRKLSREEVEKRRGSLREECKDYAPVRGGYQCQQYAGGGACERTDYFMCVVWAKRHPEEMYRVLQSERPQASTKRSEEEPPMRSRRKRRPEPEPEPERPTKPGAQVHDISSYGVKKQEDGRHLLDQPELLTESAIASLCALGIEVTVKTATGVEVTLVPKLTSSTRCELTFEHARTLVMVLQVFPGATVEQITKPKEAS